MHLPLLEDILILLSFSVFIIFFLQRIKLPPILGLLLTGMVIGPYGLSLINAVEEVEILAEVGVILLLFVIGMELSIKQLLAIKKTVFIGGTLQVGITAIIATLAYRMLGNAWNEAVFVGFLFSLSSTAVVLKVLQDRNDISSPHGRNALGILIFQDIIVVPMMLVTPIIAGQTANVGMSLLTLLIKFVVLIIFTFLSARYIVPKMLHAIAKTKSKELFLLTTITICFAVAFLTSEIGLSLALGAFLAGLIISESAYSHQATSIILPFRELFTSFFFVSIGMLLDLGFFFQNILPILGILALIFILKSIIAGTAVAVLKYPAKTVLLTGLSLFQVGEFAFILSKVGIKYELLNPTTNQYFLAVSTVSMLLTPFVIMFSKRLSEWLLRSKLGRAMKRSETPQTEHIDKDKLNKHLVIIGYGINGSNVAKAARFNDIPYVIIELNPQTVKQEKEKGEPIFYGDATNAHILEMAHIDRANAVVVAIADPAATKLIVSNIRAISNAVYLIVRTRYLRDIDALKALGADDVIPEEFETSIEIFSRVLHNFFVPVDKIESLTDSIRMDNYELFKSQKPLPRTIRPAEIADFKVTCVRVMRDSGSIVGKPLKEAQVREKHGINVMAILRDGQMQYNLTPEEHILQNDRLFVHGDPEQIEQFYRLLI